MNEISAELYSTTLIDKDYRDVIFESIDILKNLNRKFDLIIDIGCAEGGLTKLLAKHVPHKQIVAIDVVPDLISFAEKHNNDQSIDYKLADMSVDWEQLPSSITKLKETVDLVFSSFTLHYMKDKQQVMNLIWKLLAPGGIFYGNLCCIPDLNKKLLPKDNDNNSIDDNWYPTVENQMKDYEQALAVNGFVVEKFNRIDKVWETNRKDVIEMMPVLFNDYKLFYPKPMDQFDKEFRTNMLDIVFNAYTSPANEPPVPNAWQQFLANDNIQELKVYTTYLQVVAKKLEN
ncbi:uncharacterized protein LOC128963295 [Oppia nitens]|uniref:uncharacterized protein LOC128963295 n=1 Tax=Oppia nitens TaxID=1686743 RepID=UPI0023DCC11D|nr:uncharacterized protein LOC128963295 [Oppia nitens]